MVLDVTAKDREGVQVFGESKIFNMIGYTEKNRQGQPTLDNWLIRSWQDNSIQAGRAEHSFVIKVPAGAEEIEVQASLTYQVGDSITPMTKVSRRFALGHGSLGATNAPRIAGRAKTG